jgi:hypothetical protein
MAEIGPGGVINPLPVQPMAGMTFYLVPSDNFHLPTGPGDTGPWLVTMALKDEHGPIDSPPQAPYLMYVDGASQEVKCDVIVPCYGPIVTGTIYVGNIDIVRPTYPPQP